MTKAADYVWTSEGTVRAGEIISVHLVGNSVTGEHGKIDISFIGEYKELLEDMARVLNTSRGKE